MPRKLNFEELVKKSIDVHGDKYCYKDYILTNTHISGTIICPIHGEFKQSFDVHINQKSGCPKCAAILRNKKNTKFTYDKLKDNDEKYDFGYDYSQFVYNGYDSNSIVICSMHGEFKQSWHHLKFGHGCPICGNKRNNSELKLKKHLEKEFINVEYQKRFDWLGRQSLDFYLPDYNVAIEYQGRQHFCDYSLFNHDETLKNDLVKLEKCKENGVQLYHITFEEKYMPIDFHYYKLYINVDELITDIKKWQEKDLD